MDCVWSTRYRLVLKNSQVVNIYECVPDVDSRVSAAYIDKNGQSTFLHVFY